MPTRCVRTAMRAEWRRARLPESAEAALARPSCAAAAAAASCCVRWALALSHTWVCVRVEAEVGQRWIRQEKGGKGGAGRWIGGDKASEKHAGGGGAPGGRGEWEVDGGHRRGRRRLQ